MAGVVTAGHRGAVLAVPTVVGEAVAAMAAASWDVAMVEARVATRAVRRVVAAMVAHVEAAAVVRVVDVEGTTAGAADWVALLVAPKVEVGMGEVDEGGGAGSRARRKAHAANGHMQQCHPCSRVAMSEPASQSSAHSVLVRCRMKNE